ncbi:MAG: ion channel [Gemmatales bacterium]
MNLTTLYQHRFTILLLTLIVFMLCTPLIIELVTEEYAVSGKVTILVISVGWVTAATFAVSTRRRTAIIAIVLMAVSLLLELFTTLLPTNLSFILFHLLRIVFLGFIVSQVFKHIFKPRLVTFDTISASLCIYLMLGAVWAHIYAIVEMVTPGSIAYVIPHVPEQKSTEIARSFHMLYFSFVTLSTVGYGDMVPTTTVARMFAVTEAISGQIYLLVMVSRLVGLQVSQALYQPESKPDNISSANPSIKEPK